MIIRTSLALEIEQYDKRLLGYTASMSYSFAQLCVVADPSSLLPIEIRIGDGIMHMKDVASVVVHKKDDEGDDITIDLYPEDPAYITAIMEGVLSFHPEFKQSVEDVRDQPGNEELKKAMEEDGEEIDEETELHLKFIRLVMPEVNKDRRDLLINLVKGYRDALTVQFEAMKVQTEARLAPLSLGVPKDEQDAVKHRLDSTCRFYTDMADNLTEDKKEQIEEAYQAYITSANGTAEVHPEDAVNHETPKTEAPEPSGTAETPVPPAPPETPAPPLQPYGTNTIKMDW